MISTPGSKLLEIAQPLASHQAFKAIIGRTDFVFGCLDNDGSRLILNELCLAYDKPYFDLASGDRRRAETVTAAGCASAGTVMVAWFCHELLDPVEAGLDLLNDEQRRDRAAIYGVPVESLGRSRAVSRVHQRRCCFPRGHGVYVGCVRREKRAQERFDLPW